MPKTIATTPSWYWPEGVPRVLGVPPYRLEELLVERWAQRRPPAHPLVVSSDDRADAAELSARVGAAARAIGATVSPGGHVAVAAGPTAEGAVLVLGALASGRQALLVAPEGDTAGVARPPAGELAAAELAVGDAGGAVELKGAGLEAMRLDTLVARDPGDGDGRQGAAVADLRAPAACLGGRTGPAWHSHRSLVAGALALQAFLGTTDDTVWLSTFSPCTWPGLLGLSTALLAGSTLALAEPGDAARQTADETQAAWVLASLADAVPTWGGRRRRGAEPGPRAVLVTVDGPFDPDERRAVAAGANAAALTLFGMAETGLVLASHPSWYLDESVGIPVPNMHVVPADPDTGEPISTMWELVDHAMVSVWSPSLALGADGAEGGAAARGAPGRFATGVLAASDPNGMLYLVEEW